MYTSSRPMCASEHYYLYSIGPEDAGPGLCVAVPTPAANLTRMLQRRSGPHQAAGMARSMNGPAR